MRIIAGTARSLPLKTIEGPDTRPTTDRIKETLFNILQNDIPNAYFLDLFSGSGQIGLEALSRGAAYSVFIENNRKAAKCIEDNIAFTKFTKSSRLLTTDVITGMMSLEGKYTFDLIFMDPPYRQGLEKNVLMYLSRSSLLKPDSRIIVEASLDTDFSYVDSIGFQLERIKKYKTNMHVFLQRAEKEQKEG
ncbi:MAG: 16S rRNA (guanine(966)-N(2))-methyltransferase RsmD [Agathobacter sp.]